VQPTRLYWDLAPLTATPRPGLGAASLPPWIELARSRTAAIWTDRSAFPSDVRVWRSGCSCTARRCRRRRPQHHHYHWVPAHRCARDRPSARRRRTRLGLGGRKTYQVTGLQCKCPSRRSSDVRKRAKAETAYIRMGQRERGYLAWVSHNKAKVPYKPKGNIMYGLVRFEV
jgi:hypothetical protein